MPTTYKRGKKKTTTKKPTKRPAKKGSKGGSKSGAGGGEEFFGPQEPIVISGGGSVKLKMNGKFRDHGLGSWRNADAELVSISIDGGTPTPLSPTSEITIKLA